VSRGAKVAIVVLVFVLLAYGTVSFFLTIDASSHSVSDTLRPFLLTMVPVWGVTLWAVSIVLRRGAR
jgi:hypothetical protein